MNFCEGCPFAADLSGEQTELQQTDIDSDRGVANRWVDAEGNKTPWVRVMTYSDGFGTDEYAQTAEHAEAQMDECQGPEQRSRFMGLGSRAVCGAFGTAKGKSPIYGLETYCTDPGFYDFDF
ncbi:MAG TPA: hypothetical protein VGM08_03260 [Candidatus Saccharimonadales bacterium]